MNRQANNSRSNALPRGQAVRRAIERFHILSEAWILDAIAKQDFRGRVSFDVQISDGMIKVVEPSIRQSIGNFSKGG